jgi:DNA adenine methylase
MIVKKPFAWYGGKQALAPLLVSLLPVHRVYCEVFGGSGALLFAKPPSALEVFNDLDNGVVNFFRVLRNPEQVHALQHQLERTPYAREEYYSCLASWQDAPDPIEQARAWYVAVMMSMNSSIRNTGWSSTKYPNSNPARAWHNSIAHLSLCAHRLAAVQIDHRDFEDVIRAYDSPQTCFYLDPPYLPEARRKERCYHHEMSEQDHTRLLACIQHIQGMVMLSGYAHPLYQEALSSWECLTLAVRCSSVDRFDRMTPLERKRTECLWMNAACVQKQAPRQQALHIFDPDYTAASGKEVIDGA